MIAHCAPGLFRVWYQHAQQSAVDLPSPLREENRSASARELMKAFWVGLALKVI